MKKLIIKKQGILTNELTYETMEELEKGFAYHKSIKSFGVNEESHQRLISEAVPAVYEEQLVLVKEAELDESGTEITPAEYETQAVLVAPEIPAEYETIITPAEYTVEITDITEQLAAEKLAAEALLYLSETDWYIIREFDAGIPCPAEIKEERAAARLRVTK
jgi:hypothetical protein